MEITVEMLQERVAALEEAIGRIDARMDEALGGNPHGERMDGIEVSLASSNAQIASALEQMAAQDARLEECVERIEAAAERTAELEREQLELLEAIADEEEENNEEESLEDVTEIPAGYDEEKNDEDSGNNEGHNPPAFWERCLGARG